MKIAVIIVRTLLGLVFVFFGTNILFPFLKQPPLSGDTGEFAGLMARHHYMVVVGVLQLAGGLLLLVGRFVPLGLTLLGPVIVNILMFHALFMPEGIVPGAVAAVLELFLIYAYRSSFRPVFAAAPKYG